MARKRHPRPPRSRSQPQRTKQPFPSGSASPPQTAEATTVAWMLAMLAALLAEIAGVVTRWLAIRLGASSRLEMLSATLLLVAFVAGLITLILTPVTLRLRTIAPPRAVVIGAVIIGAIPIATVAILAWR